MRFGRLLRFAAPAAALIAWAPAGAQLVSDAPRLLGPHTPAGVGIYWLSGGSLPGDGDGLLVTWAPAPLGGAVGLRGGAGTGVAGSPAGFLGVDVRVPLTGRGSGSAIDVAWSTGLGASLGEYFLATLPMGLSMGFEWVSGAVTFAPYVGGGLALDVRLGEEAPDEEFSVETVGEVGVGLSLDPRRRFTLRGAVSVGERRAAALGVSLGGG